MKLSTHYRDRNGRTIHSGDRVLAYPRRYEIVVNDAGFPTDVVEVDTSKPRPTPDVALFEGSVEYSDFAFWVRLEHPEEGGPSSLRMEGMNYEFEVVGWRSP